MIGATWTTFLVSVFVMYSYELPDVIKQYQKDRANCDQIRAETPGAFTDCFVTHPLSMNELALSSLYTIATLVFGAIFFTLRKKVHPKYTVLLYLIFALLVLSAWILENGYSFLLRFFLKE